jgi:peptidylamidoglycolate lyase
MSQGGIIGATGLAVVVCISTGWAVSAALNGRKPAHGSLGAVPEANYRVVHGWPLLPENQAFDEISAVSVDSRGDVFVLHRAGRQWPESDVLDLTPIPASTVLVIDGQTGRFLSHWGSGRFALPHSVTVDLDDNVWITDVAFHQVYKQSHDGTLLLTLGERGVPGNDRRHFNRPTDVAVAPDRSFYVSDGYENNRVLKFAADGTFLLEWGSKGTGPGQFDLPHGIAVDASGRVFVVDRENARVQVFDRDGKYLAQWNTPDFVHPQDIAIDRDGTAFVSEIGDRQGARDRSGILIIRRDGTVAGKIGRRGPYDGQFLVAHGVAVGRNGEVYVADFSGRRVQKFVRTNR